ncbi:hypothetical protein [Chryseobacterium gambrini]|uniref:Uncharacterized protein n=1 Tax=Chryseobacterium gambrini TaxID=373672 RepID=A0A1N7LAB5_9FLAO|nr:hypothetical protein [Chryseobacterium gambrini]SIS70796.1 hypothetical protein SAMN05421785_10290 [Chryseobacterium gambrini]
MESLEFIFYIIKRRSLFFLENSNDYFRYIDGYISGSKNDQLYDFFKTFEVYLIEHNKLIGFENKPLHLVLNFLTIYNYETLNFLNRELINFLRDEKTHKLEIIKKYSEKYDLTTLIENYQD